MTVFRKLTRPPWRTIVPVSLLLLILAVAYFLWSPGKEIMDGRHDLGRNGIWLQHGWLGDDKWFRDNAKIDQISRFRNVERISELATKLRQHHITDVYPHLCPAAEIDGRIPAVNAAQTESFLNEFQSFRVMPWIGGVSGLHVKTGNSQWRSNFVGSVRNLLVAHPRFAGVHLNVEPMPSGDHGFLLLLEELRAALPGGKILSVAAYPPPTRWHPFPDVHWDEAYFREVASRSDQIAVMMYDTSLKYPKVYQSLMGSWTKEVLAWADGKPVLLGLPAYQDSGVGYHNPDVENLTNALLGVHRGLADSKTVPSNYQGVALYSEWEMRDTDWQNLREHFLKK